MEKFQDQGSRTEFAWQRQLHPPNSCLEEPPNLADVAREIHPVSQNLNRPRDAKARPVSAGLKSFPDTFAVFPSGSEVGKGKTSISNRLFLKIWASSSTRRGWLLMWFQGHISRAFN